MGGNYALKRRAVCSKWSEYTAIRDDLAGVKDKEAFKHHMRDVLEYRTMEYYRRRYVGE